MGRALYRESGPSQDGDPVPGNLPFLFCLISLFNLFFSDYLFLSPFYIKLINILEYIFVLTSHFIYIGKGFLPFIDKFYLFLHSYLMTCIRTLLNLNIKQITQQGFCNKVILESKHTIFHIIPVHFFLVFRRILVIYNFKSSPQLSG